MCHRAAAAAETSAAGKWEARHVRVQIACQAKTEEVEQAAWMPSHRAGAGAAAGRCRASPFLSDGGRRVWPAVPCMRRIPCMRLQQAPGDSSATLTFFPRIRSPTAPALFPQRSSTRPPKIMGTRRAAVHGQHNVALLTAQEGDLLHVCMWCLCPVRARPGAASRRCASSRQQLVCVSVCACFALSGPGAAPCRRGASNWGLGGPDAKRHHSRACCACRCRCGSVWRVRPAPPYNLLVGPSLYCIKPRLRLGRKQFE